MAIFAYEVDGHRITVDIYGGEDSTVGSLYYEIEEEDRREKMLARLEEWSTGIPLTYVSDENGMGVLMKTTDYIIHTYDS